MRGLLDPGDREAAEQSNLFDDLRLTVLEAAAAGPVMLVLEDLHWAEGSTRDLAVALSRTARDRLMLVLTVRTDDLHRRHPARKALAEIGRVPGGRHVELSPLDRNSIPPSSRRCRGAVPDPHSSVRPGTVRGQPAVRRGDRRRGGGHDPRRALRPVPRPGRPLRRWSTRAARMASVDGTRVESEPSRLAPVSTRTSSTAISTTSSTPTSCAAPQTRWSSATDWSGRPSTTAAAERAHQPPRRPRHVAPGQGRRGCRYPRLSSLSRLAFHCRPPHTTCRAPWSSSERAGPRWP